MENFHGTKCPYSGYKCLGKQKYHLMPDLRKSCFAKSDSTMFAPGSPHLKDKHCQSDIVFNVVGMSIEKLFDM